MSSTTTVHLNNLISALSLALDLAENRSLEHARRTAYLAFKIAQTLELDSITIRDVFTAAMLHDIGVTHSRKSYYTNTELLQVHPRVGAQIVNALPLPSEIEQYVLYHHANWNGESGSGLEGDKIPFGAQIVYLADQIEINYDHKKPYYLQQAEIQEWAKSRSGKSFNPIIVESFLKAQESEKFWLDFTHQNMAPTKLTRAIDSLEITFEQLRDIAIAFALIIDNKSKFTMNHSQGLTHLILKVGRKIGYDKDKLTKLEIAALLHDVGKLAVPNTILDKPGKLDDLEFAVIKSHTYYTKLILSQIPQFHEIKEWAANHHETLDGHGYPERLPRSALSQEARLMTVCDIFQALTEDRPYREPMSHEKAFGILDKMVDNHKICGECVSLLKETLD